MVDAPPWTEMVADGRAITVPVAVAFIEPEIGSNANAKTIRKNAANPTRTIAEIVRVDAAVLLGPRIDGPVARNSKRKRRRTFLRSESCL
jgi:hypothetical protein